MAISPNDMMPVEEEPNWDAVQQLETEVDEWLQSQQRGLREYTYSWENALPAIDLEAVAKTYEEAGWEVKHATGHGVSALTLKRPLVPRVNKVYRGAYVEVEDPADVVKRRLQEQTQQPPTTEAAQLPE